MPKRPPFDPEVAQVLATREDVVTSLHVDEIHELRSRAVRPTQSEMTLGGAFELSTHLAPGPSGTEVPVVLLTPRDRPEPLPVLFHVHGGGLVVGTAYDDLPSVAVLAQEAGCAVASVEYRLAPEHRYPAAVEDVYAGLVWLAETAEELGLDPARIVLDGVSAGGGLAAAAALLARDRGAPRLAGQILLCPMLDDRNDSHSAIQMAGAGAWDRAANETGWSAYLGEERTDVPVYAAPGRALDLSGLPPTYLDVGSAETFRDENVAYAQRIWACGGDAELHVWAGGAHGFDALAPTAQLTEDARRARVHWLRRLLSRIGTLAAVGLAADDKARGG